MPTWVGIPRSGMIPLETAAECVAAGIGIELVVAPEVFVPIIVGKHSWWCLGHPSSHMTDSGNLMEQYGSMCQDQVSGTCQIETSLTSHEAWKPLRNVQVEIW